jgi:hypothetical protein
MKKNTKIQKTNTTNTLNPLLTRMFDKGETITLENISPLEKEDIERKLKEIDGKIEDIGRICDKKKQKSYEDYNNVLKSNKSQFMDELTKLNFKLIEAMKMNTREDFLNKIKKDLSMIKNQVYEKDKELQSK